MEFADRRNDELMRAWMMELRNCRHIDLHAIARRVVNTRCSRFWVSEERALIVCSAMSKGKPILKTMRPTKKEMYTEIYRRVKELTEQGKTLTQAVSTVVRSPAPKFYMKPRCAIEIFYNIRRNGFVEKEKRGCVNC